MDAGLTALLTDGAARMGIDLPEGAVGRFSAYLALLQEWGAKINLTSRMGGREIVVHHFLDSLAGVPLLSGDPGARVVDIGSGAGIPAFPLKFALPELRICLVESVRKKIAFCQHVIRSTGIAGAQAHWGRSEDLAARPEHRQAYDWAVSRAVGRAAHLVSLSLPFLAPGGRILLYKGDPADDELRELEAACASHTCSWKLHPVEIPFLGERRALIVVGPLPGEGHVPG